MTDWRDDLRRVTVGKRTLIGASFRGVGFFVESSERGGGRRTVVHEFPFRDTPFVEDLGRRARPFRIEGYVVGDDYVAQKNALLAALEDKAGPGELVHPYHGTRRAIATNVTVRETRTEGGIATFGIDFIETPLQAPAPVEVVDGPGRVSASASAAAAAVAAELADQYDVAGLPAFALASAEAALVSASEGLAAKLGPIISASQELAEFTGRIAVLTAEASSLIRTPTALLEGFTGAITGLVETIADAPGDLYAALVAAYSVDLGLPVVATTATRARELANQTALIGALRRVLATEAARLVPRIPFESIDAAIAARDEVAALLEEQAADADDTSYPSLVDLRSQVLRAVPGSTDFARETTIVRTSTVPSIVLAYQLYGDTSRELDLVARNKAPHPGFLAGTLKALTDG